MCYWVVWTPPGTRLYIIIEVNSSSPLMFCSLNLGSPVKVKSGIIFSNNLKWNCSYHYPNLWPIEVNSNLVSQSHTKVISKVNCRRLLLSHKRYRSAGARKDETQESHDVCLLLVIALTELFHSERHSRDHSLAFSKLRKQLHKLPCLGLLIGRIISSSLLLF